MIAIVVENANESVISSMQQTKMLLKMVNKGALTWCNSIIKGYRSIISESINVVV